RLRANVTRGAKTRRGRNRIEHVAAASGAEPRAVRRTKTALRSRRIEPSEHEANGRVPASAKGKRPRIAGGRHTPTGSRRSGPAVSPVAGSRNRDSTPRRHRAAERPSTQGRGAKALARPGQRS